MIIIIIQVISFIFPWIIRRNILNSINNFSIHKTARIGFSIFHSNNVFIGPGVVIGHLNIFRNLEKIDIGENSRIGNLNKFGGYSGGVSFMEDSGRASRLIIGRESSITSMHILDCTNEIYIGDYTTIAGWGSQLLTHSIDFKLGKQSSAPIRIGNYCFVGTRAVLLKGCILSNCCIVGAGSVFDLKISDENTLYLGVPAISVRSLGVEYKYFSRASGRVR